MRRSLLAALAAAILACAGVAAAAGIAGSDGCVTNTTPGHTVVLDGSTATVWAGASATACPVTVTVTAPATTTGTSPTTTGTTTTTPAPATYPLDDEFNGPAGSKPSSTVWSAKTYTAGSGVIWCGWSCVSEDGQGDLVVTAQKNSTGHWTSGFLSATGAPFNGSRDITVRAKVACGAGTWSAPAWSWGAPNGSGGIEDDTSEQLGRQPSDYHTTLHNWTTSTAPQSGHDDPAGVTLCNAFHVYESRVYSDHVDYYLDGAKVWTIAASAVGLTSLTGYQEVENIDLNMGGWGGTVGSETSATMLVDYIRVSPLG